MPAAHGAAGDRARRLQRFAIGLALSAIVGAAAVGWVAYLISRESMIQGVFASHLSRTLVQVGQLELSAAPALDESILEHLRVQYDATPQRWSGGYVCVMDRTGYLVLHTRDPAKVGLPVGQGTFRGWGGTFEPASLLAVLREKRSWVGYYTSLQGETQMAAFGYSPRYNALIAAHVPWAPVEDEIELAMLPWAASFAVLVLVLLPIALLLLHKAYVDSTREVERAQEAAHAAAEQLRLLRAIDRAILAGGSAEEIVRGALIHLQPLVRCRRASVSLTEGDGTSMRILAVESGEPTGVGPGTLVDLGRLPAQELELLRAGETKIVEDLEQLRQGPPQVQRLIEEGVRSLVSVPLVARGELLGLLTLGWDRVGPPPPGSVEIGREVADLLAVGIVEVRLYEEVQRQAAELERRVEERTAQLSEVNAELEGYVHSVSHDLRAPLRAIHGFGRILLEDEGAGLSEPGREHLRRMVSAAERMDALMRNLLSYSRLARAQVHLERLDTAEVVEEARALVQSELDEQRAELTVEAPLAPVRGHRATLVLAVSNLLSNAAKFVAPGVRPRIRVGTERRAATVRLWVKDDGIGISPEDQEKIFGVFERLHGMELYPGTGIGLAIVRRAVDRMGGRAGVESRLGQGSRFWIELPAGDEAGAP